MKRICLLIGEGDSERYFFPKILERKSFKSLSLKEGSLSIYNKEDVYWFFPFPPNLGVRMSGKGRLKKSTTYTLAHSYIQTNKHIFSGDNHEIHLIAMFDTETEEAEISATRYDIGRAITTSGREFSSVTILPIAVQIESWYLAGLENTFPYFLKKDDSDLCRLLSTKTSNRHNKANFERHIDL